jgi:hypothetical protein
VADPRGRHRILSPSGPHPLRPPLRPDGSRAGFTGRSFTLDPPGGHTARFLPFPFSFLFFLFPARSASFQSSAGGLRRGQSQSDASAISRSRLANLSPLLIGVCGGDELGSRACCKPTYGRVGGRRPAASGAEIETAFAKALVASVTQRRSASSSPNRKSTLEPPAAKPCQTGLRSSRPECVPATPRYAAHATIGTFPQQMGSGGGSSEIIREAAVRPEVMPGCRSLPHSVTLGPACLDGGPEPLPRTARIFGAAWPRGMRDGKPDQSCDSLDGMVEGQFLEMFRKTEYLEEVTAQIWQASFVSSYSVRPLATIYPSSILIKGSKLHRAARDQGRGPTSRASVIKRRLWRSSHAGCLPLYCGSSI